MTQPHDDGHGAVIPSEHMDEKDIIGDEKVNNEREDVASTATSSASTKRVDADINSEKGLETPQNGIALEKDGSPTEEPAPGDPEPAAEHGPDSETPDSDNAQPSPGTPEETRTKLETTLIIAALASALFLAALDVTIVTVAIPTISEQFKSTAGYTWIGSAYLLANAAAAPVWGKISDIWGRKPILLCAVAVFWVGSLLSAVSRNMGMLIAARAIQGVGGGGIVNLVYICISDLFSIRKRGVYFGVMGMVWALAGGVGPIIGGVFTDKVTWRWCFYVNLPVSGIGMAILTFVLKLENPRTPIRAGLAAVDWLGVATIVGGTLMFLLGLEFGSVSFPWDSATVICLIIFGVVLMALFVVIEWKVAKYPVIPMHLFKERSAVGSLAVAACHGFVFISGSYYLPLYVQAVLGASPLLSGVYVLPFSISLAVFSSLAGVFIRKTGKYLPCIIFGLTVMTVGYGLFIDLGPKANWTKIIIFQLVAGIGVGPNFQGPLISLQTTVKPRDIASATATFGFVRQLATSVSVVIGGVVFQNEMQRQYPSLLAELGPDTASLLKGGNAGASVGLVAKLPGHAGEVARGAYWTSLKTMYTMYVAFAALGLLLTPLIKSRTLSKQHEEAKTGLQAMEEDRAARKLERAASDEEKAMRKAQRKAGGKQ